MAYCSQSVLTNVFVPDLGFCSDKVAKKFLANFRIEINNLDFVLAQPIDTALKSSRFADDYGADTELPHEAAAIPAWRERRDHNAIAIAALATGFAKRVRLAMDRRVVFLHAAVVPAAEQFATAVKQHSADRNAAFRKTGPRLLDRNIEHRLRVEFRPHNGNIKTKPGFVLISCRMSQPFQPGDFLVFQLEAGFATLRVLSVGEDVWHVAAYDDLFADVESAEAAANGPGNLKVSSPHIAITKRAFESTQVAKIAHRELRDHELTGLDGWREDPQRKVSDRSIRLLLGLR